VVLLNLILNSCFYLKILSETFVDLYLDKRECNFSSDPQFRVMSGSTMIPLRRYRRFDNLLHFLYCVKSVQNNQFLDSKRLSHSSLINDCKGYQCESNFLIHFLHFYFLVFPFVNLNLFIVGRILCFLKKILKLYV